MPPAAGLIALWGVCRATWGRGRREWDLGPRANFILIFFEFGSRLASTRGGRTPGGLAGVPADSPPWGVGSRSSIWTATYQGLGPEKICRRFGRVCAGRPRGELVGSRLACVTTCELRDCLVFSGDCT